MAAEPSRGETRAEYFRARLCPPELSNLHPWVIAHREGGQALRDAQRAIRMTPAEYAALRIPQVPE